MALLMNTPAKRVTHVASDIEDALIGVRRLKALIAARAAAGQLAAAAAPLITADNHLTKALAAVCDNEAELVSALEPTDET